jgi:cyclophilin family peptidyl-prolyl cis-trans isomerase
MLASLALAAAMTAPRPEVAFEVEGRGRFVMELRPDEAPKLCAHFLRLIQDRFYDRLLIHRKVDGFVIQAGCDKTRGKEPAWARKNPGEMGGTKGVGDGGSGRTVPFEINDLDHVKYSVGMALEAPMSDTGDSQWFINLAKNSRLYGSYVVFAQVTKGREVVDRLQRGDRITSARRLP